MTQISKYRTKRMKKIVPELSRPLPNTIRHALILRLKTALEESAGWKRHWNLAIVFTVVVTLIHYYSLPSYKYWNAHNTDRRLTLCSYETPMSPCSTVWAEAKRNGGYFPVRPSFKYHWRSSYNFAIILAISNVAVFRPFKSILLLIFNNM